MLSFFFTLIMSVITLVMDLKVYMNICINSWNKSAREALKVLLLDKSIFM